MPQRRALLGIHYMVDTLVMLLAPLSDMITPMKSGQAEHVHVVAANTRKGMPESEWFAEQARVLLGRNSV